MQRQYKSIHCLQLRRGAFGLSLLQNWIKLRCLHHIALDLELAGHEKLLRIGLSVDEFLELLVGE